MTRELFAPAALPYQPLAARLRPEELSAYAGQRHLLQPGLPLYEAIRLGQPHSMILWGPPGSGKTTLARLVARSAAATVESLSAVLSGVKEIRSALERAQMAQQQGRRCVLFVDEVHRFNKAQQDAFLPAIEDGTVVFVGATTENPSFELNSALLSRARVYVLKGLDQEALGEILQRALCDTQSGLGSRRLLLSDPQKQAFLQAADGDARRLLNLLEQAADLAEAGSDGVARLSSAALAPLLQAGPRRFDKGGDVFHEQISVLHKAVRGSAPDAALYWLCRMLDGGCDPLYLARRVVRMASEDIGNADPRALQLALNAWETVERLGSPEGELTLAQAVVFLACAPKSNAVYQAFNAAREEVQKSASHEVPLHLRNAATALLEKLDYGTGYRYAHDEPGAYAAGENYFPKELKDRRYYHPVDRGLEEQIRQKLAHLRSLDAASARRRYESD
jgi:putative ATPase